MDTNETFFDAFGISQDWTNKLFSEFAKKMNKNACLSDAVIDIIKELKKVSFGNEIYEISEYEKKLVVTGIEIAWVLNKFYNVNQTQQVLLNNNLKIEDFIERKRRPRNNL